MSTNEHFQFNIAHFLEAYVFSEKPKLSLRKALERYDFAVINSKSYNEFYDYLYQQDSKRSDGSYENLRMLRLAGLQWEVGGRQLVFSKEERESTKIHESVHNILNNSGMVDLSFSESFTHFISCFIAGKTGIKIDYLGDSQRKRFDTKTALAIANFPWKNITSNDVGKIAKEMRKEIARSPNVKDKLYYDYHKSLTPKVAPLFFDLLRKKLSFYSARDKKIVKKIALKGIEDCQGRKNLEGIKQQLKLLVKKAS